MRRSERLRHAAARFVLSCALMGGAAALLYGSELGVRLNTACSLWVARTNAWILRGLGVDASTDGAYIQTGAFSVLIVDRCNGLIALTLILPMCATLDAPWTRRLRRMVSATALVVVLNQVRLVIEMLVGSVEPEHYDFVEQYVMRSVFAALALLGVLEWANSGSKRPEPAKDVHA